jgi:hypothetical protein
MSSKDGENILRELKLKKEKDAKFDNEDLMKLSLIPLMGDRENIKFRIEEAFELTEELNDNYKSAINAMLYSFASKFLTGKELKNMKGMFKMTELGRMIMEDGKREGKRESQIEFATKLLKSNKHTIEDIIDYTGLRKDEILQIQNKILN